MTTQIDTPQGRVCEFAGLINEGMRPIDARGRMGLTEGQGARLMSLAKRHGLLANQDHNWMRSHNAAAAAKIRDTIAELVSEGVTLTAAAAQLGLSLSAASRHWARIRRDLGWQAV